MKQALFILIFCLPNVLNGQTWDWAKSSGSSNVDKGNGIAIDRSGNIYVTGDFRSSTITFGSTILTNAGLEDIFIVKYDPAGNVIWAKSVGGTNKEICNSIITDSIGNIYLTGYFASSSISFGTTQLNNILLRDLFIAKLDENGNEIWAKSIGGANNEEGNDLAMDGAGNIYVTGTYIGIATFGTTTLTSVGNIDIFTVKHDISGNVVWAKSAGGIGDDYSTNIDSDENGTTYLTGYYASPTMTFGTTILTNSGVTNIFTGKYDQNGNAIWAKSIGGTIADSGASIVLDGNNNFYLTGNFSSPVINFGPITLTNGGVGISPYDIYVAKLDSSGNVLWAKSAGGQGLEGARAIAIDNYGNAYITGSFTCPVINFGTSSLTNSGGADLFVAKVDSSGNFLFSKSATGSTFDAGFNIAVDSIGNVCIVGYYQSSSLTFGSTTISNSGDVDLFVAKLSFATGLNDVSSNENLIAFPNPSNGSFYLDHRSDKYVVSVYNVLGELISETETSGFRTFFNLDVPKGLYILTARSANDLANFKIIIDK